jgi:hypothetical protein
MEHVMAANIKPGQWVNITVKSEPRAAAARKTMIRLFRKDARVAAEHKRLARARPVRFDRRGGRPWGDRPKFLPVARTTPGSSYRIFASVDVLRDLKSIDKYVDVKPA